MCGSGAWGGQLCGEASACYSRWPDFDGVPARIGALLPQVKLVYALRHPVERAYSHYGHEMEERALNGTGPQLSFEDALASIPNLTDAGLYHAQIERYLARFPRGALHVLTLEDWRRDPTATWRDLQRFLGVAHVPLAADPSDAENRAGDRLARVSTKRAVRRVRSLPVLGNALRLLPAELRAKGRALLRRPAFARWLMRERVEQHRAGLARMRPETRATLLERFREPNRALERFLGRELPEWRS